MRWNLASSVGRSSIERGVSPSGYVYERNGGSWDEFAQLECSPPPLGTSGYFGFLVRVSGDDALIGSPIVSGAQFASLYLFHFDGSSWAEQDAIHHTGSTASFGQVCRRTPRLSA